MEWNLLKILSKFDISLKAQPWLQCVITSNQNQAFRNQKYSIFIYVHDKLWNSGLRNPVETFSSWNALLFLVEQESLKKTEWANCFSGFLQGMSDLWPSNCLILIEKKTPCKSLWQMAGFGVLGGVTLFFFSLRKFMAFAKWYSSILYKLSHALWQKFPPAKRCEVHLSLKQCAVHEKPTSLAFSNWKGNCRQAP